MSDPQPIEGQSSPESITVRPKDPAILRGLSKFEEVLAVLFFATLSFGVLWQVLGRYIPAVNWPGAGEIARYSLMALTFVTVGYLLGKSGQITVAVIDSAVKSRKGRTVIRFIAALLTLLICLVMVREAFGLIGQGFLRTTAVLQIPMGYLFFLPLFGFISGVIRSIMNMIYVKYPETTATTFDDTDEAETGSAVKEA